MIQSSAALRWSTAALTVTAVALGGLSAGLLSADRIVTAGFTSALNAEASKTPVAVAGARAGLPQLAGSEAFWLGSALDSVDAVPATWSEPVALGDRIIIASNGGARQIEVIDIRPLGDNSPLDRGTAVGVSQFLLITGRDTAAPDAEPIRFVVGQSAEAPVRRDRAPRAL